VGQGNSFIVKNSNIVITSNNINKALVNPTVNNGALPLEQSQFTHPIIPLEKDIGATKGYQTHYPNTTTANQVSTAGK
jgi:hypothetical protein